MPNIFIRQLRKIQFVADRLDFRSAKLESQMLSARHQKGLEEARKRNAAKRDYEEMNARYQAESELIWDPIHAQQSERLIARGRKYGVSIPPQPTSYQADNDDWMFSSNTGEWFLSKEAEDRLKREIRIERRQSYDEFRKWATVGFAFLAFLLGVISLLTKNKQRDSCPVNYYRSDTGECMFALQKTRPSEPLQQVAPQLRGAAPSGQVSSSVPRNTAK